MKWEAVDVTHQSCKYIVYSQRSSVHKREDMVNGLHLYIVFLAPSQFAKELYDGLIHIHIYALKVAAAMQGSASHLGAIWV